MSMKEGKITRVVGPVVDIEFDVELPALFNALECEINGEKIIFEVEGEEKPVCVAETISLIYSLPN